MNDDYASSGASDSGSSIINNPIVFIGVAATVLVVGYFAYKYYTKQPPVAKSDTGDGATDYTNISDTTVFPTHPQSLNGLTIGDTVKVKSGAAIIGLDKVLGVHETTTLNADTNLGKAWHLYPSSVIVRASGMTYPFYQVAVSSIVK